MSLAAGRNPRGKHTPEPWDRGRDEAQRTRQENAGRLTPQVPHPCGYAVSSSSCGSAFSTAGDGPQNETEAVTRFTGPNNQ